MVATMDTTKKDMFDRQHSEFHVLDQDSPILATGQFALDRRSSSKRNVIAGRQGRTASPVIFDHETRLRSGSLVSAETGAGHESFPSGSRTIKTYVQVPPARFGRYEQRRPGSELFLPTPLDPHKRITVFSLPTEDQNMIDQEKKGPYDRKGHPLLDLGTASPRLPFLAMPELTPNSSKVAVVEERKIMDDPPLSPISSAMSKARFSRLDVHSSVRHVINNLTIVTDHQGIFHERSASTPLDIPRASTVPPTLQRQLSSATVKTFRSAPMGISSIRAGGSSSRGAGIRPLTQVIKKGGPRFSGVDKDMIAFKRNTLFNVKSKKVVAPVTRVNSPQSPQALLQKSQNTSILPWRKRRRGETMSMLLDAGFFPVNEYIYNKETSVPERILSRKGKALSILIRDLPSSPLSFVGTPTEFYHPALPGSPRRYIRSSQRRSSMSRRRLVDHADQPTSPKTPRRAIFANALNLSPLPSPTTPSTPSRALFSLTGVPTSPLPLSERPPNILEPIAEDGNAMEEPVSSVITGEEVKMFITEEPVDVPQGVPVKTEIHLNSGTVLTVCPPESTAWTRNVYIQGPIRLLAPMVDMRKDSVASLAPFQTAVDQIYDQALLIPRRASEDQVTDDILDWYDSWGFGYPSFDLDDFKEHSQPEDPSLDKIDTPGPVDKENAAHMLKASHIPPKAVSMLGCIPNDGTASVASSPTASTFHMSSSRKSSTGTTASTRYFSGYALSPLPENSSTSPISPSSPLEAHGISSDIASSKETMNATPGTTTTQTRSHSINNNETKTSTLEWGDDDEVEETGLRPNWLMSHGHGHLEVKEIIGSRKGSVSAAHPSSDNERRGGGAAATDTTIEHGTRKRGGKKKSGETPVMRVRRFVATAGGAIL